jgi:hypothetical protein
MTRSLAYYSLAQIINAMTILLLLLLLNTILLLLLSSSLWIF